MRVHLIEAFTLPDAWYQVLKLILEKGVKFKVEKGSQGAEGALTTKVACSVFIERPEVRPLLSEKAPYSHTYLYQYYLEYLATGERKFREPYTYGERLRKPVDQIARVIERFKEARGDRQCTMVLRLPQDLNLDDPPCLTVIDTEVLENELCFYVYFRSWDAYAGFPANMAALQLLKEEMAAEIGVEPGFSVAFSKNLHIYGFEESLVREVLESSSSLSRAFSFKEP